MFSKNKIASAVAAAALAMQPTLASAQGNSCITEEEVSGMAIYAVPNLMVSMNARCAGSLSPDGFYAREGKAFAARYRAYQNQAWPNAKSAILKLGRNSISEHRDYLDIISQLPDESLRPLVDVMVSEAIAEKLAAKECQKVERVMKALAPIEPEVAGNLLAVMLTFAPESKLPICPVDPA